MTDARNDRKITPQVGDSVIVSTVPTILAAGFVLAVIVVGTLASSGSIRPAPSSAKQQHNQAVIQATTVAIATLVVDMHATDMAYGATQDVPINAAATRAVGTLAAYRATMDARVYATEAIPRR